MGGASLPATFPPMALPLRLTTWPPFTVDQPVLLPVTVDPETRKMAFGESAFKPVALLLTIEFATVTSE